MGRYNELPLTPDQEKEILELRSQGVECQVIARDYGFTHAQINRVFVKHNYRTVDGKRWDISRKLRCAELLEYIQLYDLVYGKNPNQREMIDECTRVHTHAYLIQTLWLLHRAGDIKIIDKRHHFQLLNKFQEDPNG